MRGWQKKLSSTAGLAAIDVRMIAPDPEATGEVLLSGGGRLSLDPAATTHDEQARVKALALTWRCPVWRAQSRGWGGAVRNGVASAPTGKPLAEDGDDQGWDRTMIRGWRYSQGYALALRDGGKRTEIRS